MKIIRKSHSYVDRQNTETSEKNSNKESLHLADNKRCINCIYVGSPVGRFRLNVLTFCVSIHSPTDNGWTEYIL